jgi:rod shape-determining protein MreC
VRSRPLLAVLLLTCLTLMVLDAGERSPFDPLRAAAGGVLGPVDRTVGAAAASVGEVAGALGELTDRSELADLREENARLRGELAAGEQAARRVAELEALLSSPGERESVPGRVIGAGSALGFARTVTLDLGDRDGVTEAMPVVGPAGLVGRTVRVGRWTSVVLLLDDPGFGVGARLARQGSLGLARGDGTGRLVYTQVEGGPIEVGEAVLSSGSETFAPDLPVGRVVTVRSTAGGLTWEADVEPLVDLGALDLVAVVTGPPRGTPRAPLPDPP